MSKSKELGTTEDMMMFMHHLVGRVHISTLLAELSEIDKVGTTVDYGEGEVPFEYIPTLTPAGLTVIQKFLADSNITCNSEEGSETDEIKNNLDALRSKRKNILNINKAVNE